LLERVHLLADRLARIGRRSPELLQDRRELALLAEDLRVLVAQRLLGGGLPEAREERRAELGELTIDGRGRVIFRQWGHVVRCVARFSRGFPAPTCTATDDSFRTEMQLKC